MISEQTRRKNIIIALSGFLCLAFVAADWTEKRVISGGDNHEKGYSVAFSSDSELQAGWTQKRVKSGGDNAEKGYSVAYASDSELFAVGTPGYYNERGSVDVFYETGVRKGQKHWGLQVGERGGSGVDISENGEWMVSGDPNYKVNGLTVGRTRVYRYIDGSWDKQNQFTGEEDNEQCGTSVAVDNSGTVAFGCPGQSRTRIYAIEYDGNYYQKLSSGFGGTVSMTNEGEIVAVSNPEKKKVKIFQKVNGDYTNLSTQDVPQNVIATSVVMHDEGEFRIAMGGDDSMVIVYGCTIETGTNCDCSRQGLIEFYGHAISFPSSSYLAVGDPTYRTTRGTVEVFEFNEGWTQENAAWTQKGSSIVGTENDSLAGYSVALGDDGNTLVVGSPGWENNKGQAKLYEFE